MARNGHTVIATTQVSSQVTPLREEAKALSPETLRVERLDLTDPYDIAQALTWDIDVLWNNAGMGEAGPVWEIPVDLVRRNFEVSAPSPDPGCRTPLGGRRPERQGRLHLIHGRPLYPRQLGN